MTDTQAATRPPVVAQPSRNGANALIPQDFDQVWRLATLFSRSGEMVPPIYRDNIDACALAIMWGMELGVSPIQAVQGIAVIKGRASVWGDLALALAMQHPDYIDITETPVIGANGEVTGFTCVAKRRNREDKVHTFTMQDALKAGLLGRDTPWKTYPQRMTQMRARSWAIRDQFPDALRGLYLAEEAIDIPDTDYTVTKRAPVDPIQQPQPRAEAAPASSKEEAKPEVAALEAPAPNPLDELATQQVQQQAGVDFSDMDDLDRAEVKPSGPAPKRAQAAQDALSGDLLPRDDAPPRDADRTPLGRAQASTLNAYLQTLEGVGVMEQELFDELGDSVHAGNFDAAIRWCEARLKRGRA